MSEELHPVVKLLLARMKSHPEEFVPEKGDERYVTRGAEADRWWRAMSEVQEFANEQEKKAIAAKLRELRLQQAHEWVMDELCNGEERRRKEEEDRKYYLQQAAGAQHALRAGTINSDMNSLYNQYQNALPGQYITDYDYATQNMRIKDTHTGATTTASREQLEDKGFVATMKKALGI